MTKQQDSSQITFSSRLIERNGKGKKILRSGVKRISRNDLYVTTLTSSWPRLLVSITLIYVLVNAFFASLYLLEHHGIENARPGSFTDAFFFSVQTLATIGYGKMTPATNYTNILSTIEALAGLSGLAIATGVIFSRISQPKARIIFGNHALISFYKNTDCFLFRLGNLRNSQIADPMIKAVLIQDEITADGRIRRDFQDLKLIRNNSPLLMPSWTAKHQITSDSPLFGVTPESLKEKNVEIIVSIVGFDEALSQTVHAHHSYIAEEIKFGGRFVDIISTDKQGRVNVDYKRFHDIS
jgi:inward rectifier potassium channel